MPANTESRVAAIILAAGASTRMGRNKLLLDVGGAPMVRAAAITAISAGLAPVIIVIGNEPEHVRRALHDLPCEFAINPDFTGPTSTSLHAGLNALAPDVTAVVVLLADMVRTSASMLRALTESNASGDAPLGVSRYGEVLAPPLLFRRELWPELLAWHGEGCGKAVVRAHQTEAVIHDWPADALQDVDTPEDYRRVSLLQG
jgi:molybdenum cofactor cytidylyltransferase